MNPRQTAFYRQARSDWSVFRHMKPAGAPVWVRWQRAWCRAVGVRLAFPACHELHYLQMGTEKLAKAYYQTDLRTGHAAFRRFLTDLPANPNALGPLGFASVSGLTRWAGSVKPVVDAVEDLAPSIADRKSLPNPEYPWPVAAPAVAPADYTFHAEVYSLLDAQAVSGEPPLLDVLDRMIGTMQSAGWHL